MDIRRHHTTIMRSSWEMPAHVEVSAPSLRWPCSLLKSITNQAVWFIEKSSIHGQIMVITTAEVSFNWLVGFWMRIGFQVVCWSLFSIISLSFKTWDYNYRAASRALYGDDRLLHNPDLVLADDVSWLVSFWYWIANVHNAPGVQQGQFGAATNAVNGALECRGAYQHTAKKRFEMYSRIFQVFGLPGSPNESGCYPVSGGNNNNNGGGQTGSTGGTYTIKPGDTFWLISQQFGTTVDAIMVVNPGVSATSLWVGQVINLPK